MKNDNKLTTPKQEGPVSYCHIQLEKYIPLLGPAGYCLYLPSLYSCWNHSSHFFLLFISTNISQMGFHVKVFLYLLLFLPQSIPSSLHMEDFFFIQLSVQMDPIRLFYLLHCTCEVSFCLFVCYLSRSVNVSSLEGKYFVYFNPLGFLMVLVVKSLLKPMQEM